MQQNRWKSRVEFKVLNHSCHNRISNCICICKKMYNLVVKLPSTFSVSVLCTRLLCRSLHALHCPYEMRWKLLFWGLDGKLRPSLSDFCEYRRNGVVYFDSCDFKWLFHLNILASYLTTLFQIERATKGNLFKFLWNK